MLTIRNAIRNVCAVLVVCFLANATRAQDQATSSGALVRIVVTVDELPRTASGKVKKYELVARLP